MDWDKLRVFHTVAEAGSFTRAGERLNLSQSAVSRQISALEDDLTVPVFHRHARGLLLTEQGEFLFKTVSDMSRDLSAAAIRIRDSKERPQGPLVVTTAVAVGSVWLTPRIKQFTTLYPDIELSLILTDQDLDIAMREADVAIRLGPPTQMELIQRHLFDIHYYVFASPDYIKRRGMPQSVRDLDDHELIVYGEQGTPDIQGLNWLLTVGRKKPGERRAVLKVNNVYGVFRAVESGLGIGALPRYMVEESSNLLEILPETKGPVFDFYFVYAPELKNSKRVGVFREFLMRMIAESRLA